MAFHGIMKHSGLLPHLTTKHIDFYFYPLIRDQFLLIGFMHIILYSLPILQLQTMLNSCCKCDRGVIN